MLPYIEIIQFQTILYQLIQKPTKANRHSSNSFLQVALKVDLLTLVCKLLFLIEHVGALFLSDSNVTLRAPLLLYIFMYIQM